jgi:ribonuclease P protein component
MRTKWVAPGFILQVAPQPHLRDHLTLSSLSHTIRLGFTCSKKVGNAVSRNRVKRRLKAAAQSVFTREAAYKTDYVLIGRKETKDYPFENLVQDMQKALKRLKLSRQISDQSDSPSSQKDRVL